MTVDRRLETLLSDLKTARETGRRDGQDLQAGGGGGTSGSMDQRVTRLETHFEYVRKDLDEIKTSLKKLDDLPTKRDLDSWRWQWLATGIAILALTVGGITGGLALIARFAG